MWIRSNLRSRVAIPLAIFFVFTGSFVGNAITVSPNGVNVRHSGATTVFLTFRALTPDQRLEEGLWCGELNADSSCVASTIFGRLPARSDLSRTSGAANVTDIMTIPPSVARRAFQDARSGSAGDFFYVRRFSDVSGGPDEFVAVTCRLGSGGARSPLALMDIALRFEVDRPVLFVPRGSPPARFVAEIQYNGSGRLKGRWEIVLPGDPQPTADDLLSEASLPIELRGLQRRYTVLQRFDQFLPPTGRVVLSGPDPSRMPHDTDGLYLILLRIEAVDDRESLSDTGAGVVSSGGVAGFPMPTLRYYVGTGDDLEAIENNVASESLSLIAPRPNSRIESPERLNFSWNPASGISVYRLEIENRDGSLLSALVKGNVTSYTAPPWIRERTGEWLRWRVIAIGTAERPKFRSAWRRFEITDSTSH